MLNKYINKIISLILVVTIFLPLVSNFKVYAAYTPSFELTSQAIYLMNLDTGKLIYEKNTTKQMVPASLVKIMTAIIALTETQDLDAEKIPAPSYVFDELYGIGASTADIKQGEELTMRQLLYGLLLQSACEAALIIADKLGNGKITKFVDKMNAKAKELGAKHTVFMNPHGLPDEGQYSTAEDMAIIAQYAWKNFPVFQEIVTTSSYTLPVTNKHTVPTPLINTNMMMDKSRGGSYYNKYVKGIKTGTLDEAGRCLVTTATKDGFTYLLVIMGAQYKDASGKLIPTRYDFTETTALYNWAFTTFKVKTILEATEPIGEVKVQLASKKDRILAFPKQKFTALIPDEIEASSVQRIIELKKDIKAPVTKGQNVGYVRLMLAQEEIGKVELVASESVVRSDFLYFWFGIKSFIDSFWFKLIIGLVIIAIFAYIVLVIVQNKNRKRYKQVKRRRKL